MPRPAKLWRRTGRSGWWGTIGGTKRCFGEDRKEAEKAFRRAKAEQAAPGKGADVRAGVAVVVVVILLPDSVWSRSTTTKAGQAAPQAPETPDAARDSAKARG